MVIHKIPVGSCFAIPPSAAAEHYGGAFLFYYCCFILYIAYYFLIIASCKKQFLHLNIYLFVSLKNCLPVYFFRGLKWTVLFRSKISSARFIFFCGQKVMLDQDLAALYGVETKRINEQVKRNKDRFPRRLYVSANKRRIYKFEVVICDFKMGRQKDNAICFYWTRCSHAFLGVEQ